MLPVRNAVNKYSLMLVNKDTRICLSELGENAGMSRVPACWHATNLSDCNLQVGSPAVEIPDLFQREDQRLYIAHNHRRAGHRHAVGVDDVSIQVSSPSVT